MSGLPMKNNPAGIVLVLGMGNRLCSDDAAGPLAIDRLQAECLEVPKVAYRDGGTMGLALLPEIEDAAALIAIDAAQFGAAPGSVRVFEGDAMDRQVGARKRSAHELALADLLAAAAFNGRLPPRRALVAVQPESTDLGLEPTPAVRSALQPLCDAVRELIARWAAHADIAIELHGDIHA
jgi:hydrogenase maturation protease